MMGHFGLKVFLFSVLGVGCNKARLNLAAHQSYAASASALAPAVVKELLPHVIYLSV
jgi:hypothetical protein